MIHIKAIWISWVSPQFSQFYLGHFWVSLLDKTMHSVLVGTWEYFFFQNEKKNSMTRSTVNVLYILVLSSVNQRGKNKRRVYYARD
jgi:hypothetical protein